MATTAAKIRLPLPEGGIRRDVDEHAIPPTALRDGQNWLWRDGRLVIRPGLTRYGNTLGERPTGYSLYNIRTFGAGGESITARPVQATTRGWYLWDQSVELWIDLTDSLNALTGTATTHQVFRQFLRGGTPYLLGCNHEDIPKSWDGNVGNDYANITAGGTDAPIARCMAITGDRLLLGNLRSGSTPYHYAVEVSAFQDFDSGWGGAVEVAVLVDTPGAITSMNEMGALQAVIYKEDAIYTASAQAGVTPIRFDLRQAGIDGPLSPACVMPLPLGPHVYITPSGALRAYDGVSLQPLGASDAAQTLFDEYASRDTDILLKMFGAYDARHQEVRFWFAEEGETVPNLALVVQMRNQSVWLERHATNRFTAAGYVRRGLTSTVDAVPRLFVGRSDGQTFLHTGETDDGARITHYFETGLHALDDPTRYVHVPEVEHFLRGGTRPHTLSVQLGTSTSGAARTLSTARTLTVEAATIGPYVTGHRLATRFVSLRLSGTGPGDDPREPTPEYLVLTDQAGTAWAIWMAVDGTVAVDVAPPAGFTNVSEASPLHWYEVQDEAGVTWYIWPEVDGTLQGSPAPPATGSGWAIGTGKELHSAELSPVWRLGVSTAGEVAISIALLLDLEAFETLQWRGSSIAVIPRGLR